MRLTHLAILLSTFAAPFGDLRASEPQAPILPESRVWITGASNIRRFTCKAGPLAGALDLRALATSGPLLTGENTAASASVTVTVATLDCGVGIMSRHLHDALRAARYPSIEFRLTTYEVDLRTPSPAARITGVISIAGVQRPIATTATIRQDSLGRLHVRGSYVVRPTEFGVAPPRRFGGLLRVRDRAAVHFDVALEPDRGAIDAIGCALLRSVKADLTMEATDASR
jgi:hypothetical protein